MKKQFIKMDNIEYEIASYDYINGTVLLYEVMGPKTINIPLFYLTNHGFSDALRIEFLNKGEQIERRKVSTKKGCRWDEVRPRQDRISLFITDCIRKIISSLNFWS